MKKNPGRKEWRQDRVRSRKAAGRINAAMHNWRAMIAARKHRKIRTRKRTAREFAALAKERKEQSE